MKKDISLIKYTIGVSIYINKISYYSCKDVSVVLTFNMSLKILKIASFVENILSVPRNYLLLSPLFRFFMCIRLVLETVLYVIDFINSSTLYSAVHRRWIIIIYHIDQGTSILIILLALCYCKKYKILMEYITDNHTYFSKDKLYMQNLQKYFRRVQITVTLIFIIQPFLHCCLIILYNQISFIFICRMYHVIFCFTRYILQYFILSTYLYIISEQIKSITRRMLNVKSLIFTVTHDLQPHELDITSFNKFKIAYMNIKDTLNLINSIYGIQVSCTDIVLF